MAINIGRLEADLAVNSKDLEGGIARAKAAIGQIQSAIHNLNNEFRAGNIIAGDYYRAANQLHSAQNRLNAALPAAYGQLVNTGKAMNLVGASAASSGRSLLQFAYFVDDMRYGLMAVTNNIPGIVASLGGSAGLAGALGIAAVGASVLVNHIGEISHAIGLMSEEVDGSLDRLGKLEERIKELKAQKVRIPVEVHELDAAEAQAKQLKEGLTAIEKFRALQSDAETKSGKEISNIFSEAPGGAKRVIERLESAERKKLLEQNPDIKEAEQKLPEAQNKIKEIEDQIKNAVDPEQIGVLSVELGKAIDAEKKLQDEINAAWARINKTNGAPSQTVGGIFSRSTQGSADDIRNAQKQLVEKLLAIGEKDLAKKVSEASPEAQQKELDQKEADKKAKAAASAAAAKEAADKKLVQESIDAAKRQIPDFGRVVTALQDEMVTGVKSQKTAINELFKRILGGTDLEVDAAYKAAESSLKNAAKGGDAGGGLVDRTTKNLQEWFNRRASEAVAGGKALPGARDVFGRMTAAGVGEKGAANTAPAVLARLRENYEKALAAKAEQMGVTPQIAAEKMAAEARERDERKVRESNQKVEEARRQDAAIRKRGVEATEAAIPGFDKKLELRAAQAAMGIGGLTPEKLQEQLAKTFMEKGGLNEGQAAAAAEGLVKDATQKFRDRAAELAMTPQQTTRFAIQDFAGAEARIQAGVGGDNLPRKQVNLLEMLVQQGAQMIRIAGNTVSFQVN